MTTIEIYSDLEEIEFVGFLRRRNEMVISCFQLNIKTIAI